MYREQREVKHTQGIMDYLVDMSEFLHAMSGRCRLGEHSCTC